MSRYGKWKLAEKYIFFTLFTKSVDYWSPQTSVGVLKTGIYLAAHTDTHTQTIITPSAWHLFGCSHSPPCFSLFLYPIQVRNEQQHPDQCNIHTVMLHSNYSPSVKWHSSLCAAVNWPCLNTDSLGNPHSCPLLERNGCEGKKTVGCRAANIGVVFVCKTVCGSQDAYGDHYEAWILWNSF